MPQSSWKRFLNSIKPPAAAPPREQERPATKRPSGLKRLWNELKPPPAVKPAEAGISPEERRRRRRLVFASIAVVLVGSGAWGVYLYIASAPLRAEKVFQEGMRRMGAGDYKGAADTFTEAIRIWSGMASAYLERGLALKDMNQDDAAIQDFERAVSLDSSLAPAHTALGTVYRERGDLTRAMNEFGVAIDLNSNMEALYQRGEIHESLGQHAEAIRDYDAAIHDQPDAPYVYRARAMARDAMGDHENAEEDRRTAIRMER